MSDRWSATSLSVIVDAIWSNWGEAVRSANHPLRLGILATLSAHGVSQRTLVLRACDQGVRTIASYTDVRSPKVREINAESRVSWLFFDSIDKVQIRVEGQARVQIDGDDVDAGWSMVPTGDKLNYIGVLPPGTAVNAATSNLPHAIKEGHANGFDDERDAGLLEAGRKNFGVLVTTVNQIDWLWLKDGGHVRCRFKFDEAIQELQGTWLTP